MDKLTAVSGILFLVADVFAIASLAHPEWIVSDVNGTVTVNFCDMWFRDRLIVVKFIERLNNINLSILNRLYICMLS